MSKPVKALSREDILGANDREVQWVDVPEWGGRVYFRQLNGIERERWESDVPTKDPKTGESDREPGFVRARLLVFACCDEAGNQLFTTEDVMALAQKSASGLERVYDRVARLNKVTDADVAEIEGN